MSQKTYKIGQFVKFIDGHELSGTIAVIETVFEDKSMKVRILKGQKGAGQVYGTYPEFVEEFVVKATEIHETSGETPPPPEGPDETTIEETVKEKPWFPVAVVLVVLVAAETAYLLVGRSSTPPPQPAQASASSTGSAQLFVELQTAELNRLNAEDVADLSAVKDARERMEARKAKKEEILRTLNPYR